LAKRYEWVWSKRQDNERMKPYILTSPDLAGENIASGGTRVMWGLFGWLLAKGQVCYMNRWTDGEQIAIYPEIQTGNPAHATTVVRYILNTPGIMGAIYADGKTIPGPTTFDSTDKIFVFSKIYDTFGVNAKHILFLPIINMSVFRDQHRERTKTCYLVGKGFNKHKHPSDSIEITRAFAQDQQALANLLNECYMLYGYDRLSAMYEVARLCGCPVRYYGDYSEEQLQKYEPGMNGWTMGNKKEEKLYTTVFRAHYKSMIFEFSKKLDYFIEETQA